MSSTGPDLAECCELLERVHLNKPCPDCGRLSLERVTAANYSTDRWYLIGSTTVCMPCAQRE